MKILQKFIVAAGLSLSVLPSTANATDFLYGEFTSYSQNTWGLKPPAGPPASLVIAPNPNGGQNFDFLYPSGLTVGLFSPGRRMLFDSGDAVLTYLPQPGPPGALNSSVFDPGGPGQSTSTGVFGGQVVALFLNIDFNDAGFIPHPVGVTYGDLIITGYSGDLAGLNGLSVRQFRGLANTALGAGDTAISIADLSSVLMLLNGAFESGFVSDFATAHLTLPDVVPPPSTVPEPSNWAMLIVGFGMIGGLSRTRRNGPVLQKE